MATEVASAYVSIGARIGALEAGLAKANAGLTGFSKRADATSARSTAAFSRIGRGASIGALAVGAGLGIAVKVAATFEKQMSQVRAVSGATGAQMQQLASAAKDLGASTKFSALEVAAAQTELGKAGMTVQQIIGGALPASLALAAAGNMDLAAAAKTVSDSMGVFGLKASAATSIADAMATAANITTADVADFSSGMENAGATSRMAGMSFLDTMTALTVLAKAGTKGAEAGTNVKSFLTNIATPSTKAQAAMDKLGISFFDAGGKIKSLGAISNMLRTRLAGQTKEQNLNTAATIAGSYGAKTFAALMNSTPAKIAGYEAALAKSGTAAKVAGVMNDNLAAKVEQMMGSLQSLAITVGEVLIPPLSFVAEKVAAFAARLNECKPALIAVVTALGAFAAAVVTVKLANFVGSVQTAISTLGGLSAAMQKSAVGAKLLAMATSPMALGITAAVAAATTLAVVIGPDLVASFRGAGSAVDQYRTAISASATAQQALAASTPGMVGALLTLTAAQDAEKVSGDKVAASKRALATAQATYGAGSSQAAAASRTLTAAQREHTASMVATDSATQPAIDGILGYASALHESTSALGRMVSAATPQIGMLSSVAATVEEGARRTGAAMKVVGKGPEFAKQTSDLKDLSVQLSGLPGPYKALGKAAADAAKMPPGQARVDAVKNLETKIKGAADKLKGLGTQTATVKVVAKADRAMSDLDKVKQSLGLLDGSSANVTVTTTTVKRAGGGFIPGFAGGGRVSGPGGVDKVPAMLTAGEVVLNKRQQALVNGGMSIMDALRRTGGSMGGAAFRGGGLVAQESAARATLKAARAASTGAGSGGGSKVTEGEAKNLTKLEKRLAGISGKIKNRMDALAPGFQRAFDAIKSDKLKAFDKETTDSVTAVAKTTKAQMDNLSMTYNGGVKMVDGAWVRINGSIADAEAGTATNLKAINDRYKVSFADLDKQYKGLQKSLTAQYDALTPAEAALKGIQDAANQLDLGTAVADAQAQLAEAQNFGDAGAIVAAQKALQDANRAVTVDGLTTTAEAERAAKETARAEAQAAQDAAYTTAQESLQAALDAELLAETTAGQTRAMILNQQLADDQTRADEAAAIAATVAAEARELDRVRLENQLADAEAGFMRSRIGHLMHYKKALKNADKFGRDMEESGGRIGDMFADGIRSSIAGVAGASRALAQLVAKYLETGSPTELGPMSTLDHWWNGMAPALVAGLDDKTLAAGLTNAARLDGAAVGGSFRAGGSSGPATVNITITDQTFAGMSREQADRVARQVQGALDRQVRATF